MQPRLQKYCGPLGGLTTWPQKRLEKQRLESNGTSACVEPMIVTPFTSPRMHKALWSVMLPFIGCPISSCLALKVICPSFSLKKHIVARGSEENSLKQFQMKQKNAVVLGSCLSQAAAVNHTGANSIRKEAGLSAIAWQISFSNYKVPNNVDGLPPKHKHWASPRRAWGQKPKGITPDTRFLALKLRFTREKASPHLEPLEDPLALKSFLQTRKV